MHILEKIGWPIILVGFFLKAYTIPGADLLLVISLSALALFYFYLGFLVFNEIRLRSIVRKAAFSGLSFRRIAVSIAVGWILSTLCIGMMFKLLLLKGSQPMLGFGIAAGVFLAITMASFGNPKNRLFSRRIFVRLGLIWALSFILYFTPEDRLIDFFYRHAPERAEEIKQSRFIQEDSAATPEQN